MSKYTTEVRYICEYYASNQHEDYSAIDATINTALPKIFDFDFPIYDESYRSVLERKIIRHYYFREIGLETVAQWKFYLCNKLNEIMPYYNQLYKSTLLEFNPMFDTDITRDHTSNLKHDEKTSSSGNSSYTRTDNLTQTDSSNVESTYQNSHTTHDAEMYSDTPQGELTDVLDGKYLTQARVLDSDYTTDDAVHSDSSGTTKNTGTVNNIGDTSSANARNFNSTEDYIEHVTGKISGESYSKRLLEFRKTFLNIDMQIIKELNGLFINLW